MGGSSSAGNGFIWFIVFILLIIFLYMTYYACYKPWKRDSCQFVYILRRLPDCMLWVFCCECVYKHRHFLTPLLEWWKGIYGCCGEHCSAFCACCCPCFWREPVQEEYTRSMNVQEYETGQFTHLSQADLGRKVFQMLDKDGDGVISREEFMHGAMVVADDINHVGRIVPPGQDVDIQTRLFRYETDVPPTWQLQDQHMRGSLNRHHQELDTYTQTRYQTGMMPLHMQSVPGGIQTQVQSTMQTVQSGFESGLQSLHGQLQTFQGQMAMPGFGDASGVGYSFTAGQPRDH